MSYLLNNEQKLNDIIFANRNKAYGAYVLRSDYGNTLLKSLSIVLFGVSSVAFVTYLFFRKPANAPSAAGQVFIHDSVYVIPFDLKKEEQKKTVSVESRTPLKQLDKKPDLSPTKFMVTDSVAKDHSADLVTPTTSATSSTAGVSSGTNTVGTATTDVASAVSGTPGGEIVEVISVDEEPEFDGGLKALYKFIKDNVRYPEPAYDAGVDGTVYVKFVVDETGKVTRLSLLNSKGYGLDEEALRVVGMLPKFKKSAKVNGRNVKVYYQLPIRFHIAH